MSQTVERAIEILKFIGLKPRALGEVSEMLEVHKSTALRLLQTLEKKGFARRMPDGKHGIGLAIIPLAQNALDQMDIRTIAHPHLQKLNESVRHTIHLAQLIGNEIIYIDKVEGSGTVAMGSRIGLPAEIHTAGVAKAILAYLSDNRRDEVIRRANFVRYTPTTILTASALRRELEITRQRGWAEDNREKEDYINCVAFPIFDAAGAVKAGMSVTALLAAEPLDKMREKIPEFRRIAFVISQELGWDGNEYGRR